MLPYVVCHKMHDLDQCFEFEERSLSKRKDFLKIKSMCYRCYNRGHIAKFYKQRKSCQIHVCNSTALHDPHWKPPNTVSLIKRRKLRTPAELIQKTTPQRIKLTLVQQFVTSLKLVMHQSTWAYIVPVWLYDNNNPNEKVYAVLDNAGGGTFIKQETLRKLGMTESNFKPRLTFQYSHVSIQLPRTYARQ
jgi:hypothetical protein